MVLRPVRVCGVSRMENGVSKPGRKWVRWNKGLRMRFLDHLAATGNVIESATAIGVDPYSVYHLRRRDPSFVAEWSEALKLGYQMLETQLVGHALAGKNTAEKLERSGLAPIDTHLALTMLTAHRNALAGQAPKGGPKRRYASEEETNEALMKKLDVVEKRLRNEAK
jgi:hypothetical protein